MEHTESSAVLPVPAPDPEVFRRVWDRVMAGEAPPENACPLPCPKPNQPPASPDCDFLLPLVDLAARRAAALAALARRGGSAARSLSAMAADCRTDFRRLSTAHFLITGQRYHPAAGCPLLPPDSALALRDRWLECIQWQTLCEKSAAATAEPVLSNLLQELRQQGMDHAALLRALLEKRCPLP